MREGSITTPHREPTDIRSIAADHLSTKGASNVACDACVLINFLNVGRIGILGELPQYRFWIPDAVDDEVTKPEQRRGLDTAYRQQIVYPADAPRIEEIRVFTRLTRSMGKGEAACLAAAQCRGWMLASDEKGKFKTMAVKGIGQERIIGTAGILRAAIRNGSITVSQADEIKDDMEGHAFKMSFRSFSE